MTDPPVLPVAYSLPPDYNMTAGLEEAAERMYRDAEERCIAFRETGRHRWEQDASPTFMCARPASRSWIGYGEHCVSPARWVDRFGQHDEPCGLSRLPDIECVICGREADYLCDAPRCDRPICDGHRHAAGRGLDFCPDHLP